MEDNIERGETKKFKPSSNLIKIKEYLNDYYHFRRNILKGTIEYRPVGDNEFIIFGEQELADVTIDIDINGIKKPQEYINLLLKSSEVPNYYPIEEYFKNLEYKGKGHIDKLISNVILDDLDLSIADKNYKDLFTHYFRKWLYACYNCFMGVHKNDVMLILIGAQGRFKTSFLNFLTPDDFKEYVVTTHINPSLSDYATASFLTEKIFINVDDQMESIFGRDYNSMKAIISVDEIAHRKKYAGNFKSMKRIANFCGSVNEPRFLRDSNNRRYLCFLLKDIMPEYIKVDIKALWAEVREEVKELKGYFLFTKEDFANIDYLNSYFHAPSIEEETLKSIFKLPSKEDMEYGRVYFLQFSEILKTLKYDSADNNLKIHSLQAALRKNNFIASSKRLKRFGNSPRYVFSLSLLKGTIGLINYLEPYKVDITDREYEKDNDCL